MTFLHLYLLTVFVYSVISSVFIFILFAGLWCRIKDYVKIADTCDKFVKKSIFYSKIYEILDRAFCIFPIILGRVGPNNDSNIKTTRIRRRATPLTIKDGRRRRRTHY